MRKTNAQVRATVDAAYDHVQGRYFELHRLADAVVKAYDHSSSCEDYPPALSGAVEALRKGMEP